MTPRQNAYRLNAALCNAKWMQQASHTHHDTKHVRSEAWKHFGFSIIDRIIVALLNTAAFLPQQEILVTFHPASQVRQNRHSVV